MNDGKVKKRQRMKDRKEDGRKLKEEEGKRG